MTTSLFHDPVHRKGIMRECEERMPPVMAGAMGKRTVREKVAPFASGEDFYAEDEEVLAEAA